MSAVPQPDNDNTVELFDREFSSFGLQHRLGFLPVDEAEEDRLEAQNRILRQLFGNRLVFSPFPPIGVSEPTVLDCGFGKGHWLDDLLEEYESCEATGVDFNIGEDQDDDDDDDDDDEADDDVAGGVQEYHKKRWNLNAPFRESGLEPRSFDLVQSRCVADGIDSTRWTGYIEDLRKLLKPGGYLQMVEIQYQFQSNAGRDIPSLLYWNERYKQVLSSDTDPHYRRNPRAGQSLGGWIRRAGFEAVQERVLELPIGGWKTGLQQLGIENLENTRNFLESWSPVACKSVLHMSDSAYNALRAGFLSELSNPQLRLYLNVYVAWGRKPARSR